jgi:hypothetical protein
MSVIRKDGFAFNFDDLEIVTPHSEQPGDFDLLFGTIFSELLPLKTRYLYQVAHVYLVQLLEKSNFKILVNCKIFISKILLDSL